MYRLIVNTKTEFDSAICELLVSYFGQLEVIPYSDHYCLVQAIEIHDEKQFFQRTNIFMQDNESTVNKMLISSLNKEIDHQVSLLHRIALNGFYSSSKPPKFLMAEIFKVDSELWMICPLEFDYND